VTLIDERPVARARAAEAPECDVAIVGAGPYGLSAAAHLGAIDGLDVRIFGPPMSFWERNMPEGMLLRSPWVASNLSHPGRQFTLDHYRADISYAMRITWGGEFIHAAPWSVGDQGVNNVSHGCVNMSWDNAVWLFGVTHIGDPVTVRGTEVQLVNGNGFTAWNMSWPDFIKGSALPVR